MQSLNDYDFLVIGLWRARLSIMRAAVESILSEKFPDGRFRVAESGLDLRWVYERRPPRGGAHEKRAVLFEPRNSTGTTALISNLEDGWVTMCNVLASRITGQHLLFRSCIDTDYPVADFELWEDGASVRYVGALRDDPGWEFLSRGEPKAFEDIAQYKKRSIADRMNRRILLDYAGSLGWNLREDHFWESEIPAVHVEEKRN